MSWERNICKKEKNGAAGAAPQIFLLFENADEIAPFFLLDAKPVD